MRDAGFNLRGTDKFLRSADYFLRGTCFLLRDAGSLFLKDFFRAAFLFRRFSRASGVQLAKASLFMRAWMFSRFHFCRPDPIAA